MDKKFKILLLLAVIIISPIPYLCDYYYRYSLFDWIVSIFWVLLSVTYLFVWRNWFNMLIIVLLSLIALWPFLKSLYAMLYWSISPTGFGL